MGHRDAVWARLGALGLSFLMVACGGSDQPRGLITTTGPTTAGGADGGGDAAVNGPGDGGNSGVDANLSGDGGNGSSDGGADGGDGGPQIVECGEVTRQPELGKPVDIVWVIDNSGSMGDEASSVATNLVSFADALQASQLDYHLVVISELGFVPEYAQLATSLPMDRFLFINENVQSQDPLQDLVGTYPRYEPFLRDSAVLHFVAVTDDEAACEGGWQQCAPFIGSLWNDPQGRANSAQTAFETNMAAQTGGKEFIFHAIASPDPTCSGAAAPGLSYYQLADATGGRTFEVCSPDWSTLFDELGTAIDESVEVSCSIPIPEPPEGFALNPTQVVLEFTVGGTTTALSRVAGEASCDNGDWYFDRPLLPQLIELCPDACGTLSSDATARLDVTLECGANACAGVRVDAEIFSTPLDVVLIVDGSASMAEELPKLQAQLQGLAADLDDAGLDYQILVARPAAAALTVPTSGNFVELDMALSGGNLLVQTAANLGSISSRLRAGAVTHLVFVTDDESGLLSDAATPTPLAEVQNVVDSFLATLTGAAGLNRDVTVHAVASEEPVCSGTDGAAVAPGRVYYGLANDTGGTTHSVCSDDWGAMFDQIAVATATSVPIDCAYALPDPPEGQVFSADEVNVRFGYAGAANPTIIGNTSGASDCDAGGWYYDNPADPGMIELCPVSCDEVQGKAGAAIDIELGCETEVIVLE